jgi:pimeloyl-ACP methyl ester carboxylesterase
MGGLVALDLALCAPARVEALALVSTGAKVSLPAETIETWRLVMTGRAPQPFNASGYGDDPAFEILREGWEQQVRTDPRVRYFDLLVATAADYRSRLGELRCPVLVVSGAKDPLTPPADSELLAEQIRGARRVEIAGAGHFLYRERPDELHAALDGFLDTL